MVSDVAVSFVVPTRDSARTIEACLLSIRGQTGQAIELIVVDNFSTDGTLEHARTLADVVISAGPERSTQRNLGGAAAHGAYLVFIDSDMVLDPAVASEIAAEFSRHPEVGGVVLPELSFGSGFWSNCKALEKRLYLGDPCVEAARAFRRQVFVDAGGYDTSLTGPEDWDLPDRVREAGWAIGRIKAHVHHDEGRLILKDTFRKKRYYGRTMAPYFARHGVTGARKAARSSLFREPSRFVREPVQSLGLLSLKAVELTGLVIGISDGVRASRASGRRKARS